MISFECRQPFTPLAIPHPQHRITVQHSTCQKLGHTNSIIVTIFNTGAWIIRSEMYFTALAWHHIFSLPRALSIVLIENSSYFFFSLISYLYWKCTALLSWQGGHVLDTMGLHLNTQVMHYMNMIYIMSKAKKCILECTRLSTFKNVEILTESCLLEWRKEWFLFLLPSNS